MNTSFLQTDDRLQDKLFISVNWLKEATVTEGVITGSTGNVVARTFINVLIKVFFRIFCEEFIPGD